MKRIFFIVLVLCNYYYQEFDIYLESDNTTIIEKDEYINNNEVGYLKVLGTKIDYKVLKHKNNDYYLKHNYKNNYSSSGWIFMDYRNNDKVLDKNTIIYGHSMLNGTMFGTLKKVLKKDWLLNKENHIITFNTKYKNMKWQVFSVYVIDKETYYLNIETNNVFINIIKSRSIYDFDVKVSQEDYILTLSTCYKNNKRLVLHAKKIRDYSFK